MNLPKSVKSLVVLGVIFASYVCYVLVQTNDHALPAWNFFYGVLWSICLLCGWGLWNSKAWALKLSYLLALAGLGLGLYFVHFAWTFWIFKRPSFMDRVLAVLNLRIFVFTLIPVAWGVFFTRSNIRAYFQS
jgi:surface polysaccharide O-acyltransferase-like enzyme